MHPIVGELRWRRETLELGSADAQRIVVFLPDDDATARAMDEPRREPPRALGIVS